MLNHQKETSPLAQPGNRPEFPWQVKVEDPIEIFNPEGLAVDQIEGVKKFLQAVFEETSEYWKAMGCRNTKYILPAVNRITAEMAGEIPFKEFRIMRFFRAHYFLVSDNSPDTFIFDPTGIKLTEDDPFSIRGYAGLSSKAPYPHRSIYRHRKPLDSWGTRALPPGFHP